MPVKLKEVLAQADALVPNAYSPAQKTAWVSELEGRIRLNVHLLSPENLSPYTYPEDQETELLLAFPHDDLYLAYLRAMIDLNNGEMDRYAVSAQVYNAKYGDYVRWYARNYEPAQRRAEAVDTGETVTENTGETVTEEAE